MLILRSQISGLKWAETRESASSCLIVICLSVQLYDWAWRDDGAASRLRRLTFFKLCAALAEKLKGLFNLFVRHVLPAACAALDANNSIHAGKVPTLINAEVGVVF